MSTNVAAIMHNTVCVLAFVLLAVIFKHWWIVFFAWIFFIHPSSTTTTTINDTDETKGNDNE